jgi:transposase-like protein
MARRGYPPEFRRRVIDLVEGGRKVAEVAVELEVSEQTIYPDRARMPRSRLGCHISTYRRCRKRSL